jgi:hypothetical protein
LAWRFSNSKRKTLSGTDDRMSGPATDNAPIWHDDIEAAEWDRAVAALGGHPLQSALWGDARRDVDGIDDRRWMALRDGQPVWLARIEKRRTPVGWIGWVPRGPTGKLEGMSDLPDSLRQRIRKEGAILLVTDRWCRSRAGRPRRRAPGTIWIDLTCGLDTLSKNFDKQWRYGIGRSRRDGVIVRMATDATEICRFFSLCETVAETKHFDFTASPALMERLLARTDGPVEARLFLACLKGEVAAGAFVFRCGRSLHYFWGATDRAQVRVRAAEALQWAAIEWGVAQGCTRYDLEGIDPLRNPGTYAFKKKMGGEEITLAGRQYLPIGVRGRVLAWADGTFR